MASNDIEIIKDTIYYTEDRLPVDVVPENYKLTLTPDINSFTFIGNVIIEFVDQDKSVAEIILNSAELDIKDGFVEDKDGSIIRLNKIIQNEELETAALKFEKDDFKPRSLTLNYSGILNDKMKGFYRSRFQIDGKDVYAATTQFEPTDARRAFPCFDEPALKASFDVTIIYDSKPIENNENKYNIVALSNGDLVGETPTGDGKIVAKFEKSPKMSTYLLAFVIGPFEFIEAPKLANSDCRIRLYTIPGKKEQGRFGLNMACKSIEFHEQYFNVKYPLSKLDLIAIPDFAAGAMENWGLITYRETTLLYDEKLTSTSAKEYIAMVVAHEIAHQWFGNLVTMEWWTHLWLNEGFARFMQFLCVDKYFPEWDLWSSFVSSYTTSALYLDALDNSHPIEVPVKKASEVDEIFDNISYNKGGSILRMMYHYIGDDSFRKGLNEYLNKFAYQNAFTEDLWDCLGRASGKPVREVMSTWTAQMGFPWVKIDTKSDNDDLHIELTQAKFSANGGLQPGDESKLWQIPITIQSGSPNMVYEKGTILREKTSSFTLRNQGDHWFKLNRNNVGFYRTSYPTDLLKKLTEQIRFDHKNKIDDPNYEESLTPLDRLGIQNDYAALCQAGHVRTADLLELLSGFENETTYTVWNTIDSCIGRLAGLYTDTEYMEPFEAFGRHLYRNIFDRLTWEPREGEHHTDGMLRALVIMRLISFKQESTIGEAKQLFRSQLEKKVSIIPDLRAAIYIAIAKYGDDQDFDHLFRMHGEESSPEEKNRLARALASTANPERLERVIKFTLSDAIRNQNKIHVVAQLGRSNPARAWTFFTENEQYLRDRFESGPMMKYFIQASASNFRTEEQAKEVENYFKDHKFSGTERNVQQCIETIRLSTKWLKRHHSEGGVSEFLSKYIGLSQN